MSDPAILGKPLLDGTLVSRAPGFRVLGTRKPVLLIEPETGCWGQASKLALQIYRELNRPDTYGNLKRKYADYPNLGQTLLDLFSMGALHFSGRRSPKAALPANAPQDSLFLAFHLAQGCNFACTYCYNSSTSDKKSFMPASIALDIIETACLRSSAKRLFVDFLGGEPLLFFDVMREIIEKGQHVAQRYGKKIGWMVQTNGLLLDKDKALFLRDNNVGTGVSIDGPSFIHDASRRSAGGQGTHAIVEKNFLMARKAGLEASPLAVIWNPANFVPVLEYFIGVLGVRTMRFNRFSRLGRARECRLEEFSASLYHKGFMDMVHRAIEIAADSGPLRIDDLRWMLRSIIYRDAGFMCMRSPCGMGEAILAFAPDGSVYACEEHEERTDALMRLGNYHDFSWEEPLKNEALQKLKKRNINDIPKCSRCLFRFFCGGGCTHKSLAHFGELRREDPQCRFYELTFPALMRMACSIPQLTQFLDIGG